MTATTIKRRRTTAAEDLTALEEAPKPRRRRKAAASVEAEEAAIEEDPTDEGETEPPTQKTRKPGKRRRATEPEPPTEAAEAAEATEAAIDPEAEEAAAAPVTPHPSMQVEQKPFLAALEFAKLSVPARPSQPILINAHLEAIGDGRLRIMTTDLTVTCAATLDVTVMQSGAVTLPAKLAAEIVAGMPTGTIQFDPASTIPSVSISKGVAKGSKDKGAKADEAALFTLTQLVDSQNGCTTIRGMEPSSFPLQLQPKISKSHLLTCAFVKAAIDSVLFAAATDEKLITFTALLWEFSPQSGELKLTATDQHRVAMARAIVGVGKKRSSDVLCCLIPAKPLKELSKLFSKLESGTLMKFGYDPNDRRAIFEFEAQEVVQTFAIRCVEGEFPPVQAVIAQQPAPILSLKASKFELLEALKRIATFGKDATVSLTVQGTLVPTIGLATDMGQGTMKLNVTCTATAKDGSNVESMTVRYNSRYLIQILEALQSNQVAIQISSPTTITQLATAGEFEVTGLELETQYYVMPIQPRL